MNSIVRIAGLALLMMTGPILGLSLAHVISPSTVASTSTPNLESCGNIINAYQEPCLKFAKNCYQVKQIIQKEHNSLGERNLSICESQGGDFPNYN